MASSSSFNRMRQSKQPISAVLGHSSKIVSARRCDEFKLDLIVPYQLVLALDLEGVHDLKLHHPSSSVATSNQ